MHSLTLTIIYRKYWTWTALPLRVVVTLKKVSLQILTSKLSPRPRYMHSFLILQKLVTYL